MNTIQIRTIVEIMMSPDFTQVSSCHYPFSEEDMDLLEGLHGTGQEIIATCLFLESLRREFIIMVTNYLASKDGNTLEDLKDPKRQEEIFSRVRTFFSKILDSEIQDSFEYILREVDSLKEPPRNQSPETDERGK